MQTLNPTFAALPQGRSEAPGSIYIPITGSMQPTRPATPGRRLGRGRFLSQRYDAVLSVLAMMGLLSPLVLGSLMFAATSV
jgi:hypothetical protein